MESPLRQISAASAAAVCFCAHVRARACAIRAPETLRARSSPLIFRACLLFIYLFIFSLFSKKVETGGDATRRCFIARQEIAGPQQQTSSSAALQTRAVSPEVSAKRSAPLGTRDEDLVTHRHSHLHKCDVKVQADWL